jgi:putative DNA primase/helicase
MPVFEGAQGAGKSSALRILGGEFFSESLEDMGNKDFYLSLDGHWLMEIPELQSMTRAEVERIKAVLSRQVDSYRAPYGRCIEEHPRQVIFAGTTNRDDWHQDETGGRRFLPIRCGNINLDWLRENRDQLFAEAMARFNRDERWWDIPPQLAAEEVAARHPDDTWEDLLRDFLEAGRRYSTKDLLDHIGIVSGQQTQVHSRRVCGIMRRLGWKQSSVRTDAGTKQKMWIQS